MSNKEKKIHNILYCEGNTDGTVGGSYYSLLYLTRGLDKSKFKPTVVFLEDNTLIPEYKKAGVDVLIVPKYEPVVLVSNNKYLSKFNFLLNVAQKITNLFGYLVISSVKLAKIMRSYDIDLLHLNNSILRNNDWMVAAIIARVPCITHERGINQYYPFISRMLAKTLKSIISISGSVTNSLRDNGVRNVNIVTIYNGIDPEDVKSRVAGKDILSELEIDQKSNIIGLIGNIKEWKGQEVAVKAMKKVVDIFPDTVCLLIGDTAKEDAHYKVKLDKMINDFNLENNVKFTGYIDNVPEYLNILNFVLHTSIDPEPFGRVLIEAMSLSKPLIASNDGAIPEIIENHKSGICFKPGDHEELAKYVIQLIKDKKVAEEMGKNGYDRLLANFHIKVNIEKTQALYGNILKSE